MVLIGELVKVLNLYTNLGVAHHSNTNNNSNARVASKKFWMQKAQSNGVFLTWSLCFISILFVTFLPLVFCFLFFWLLGFALHYIHTFHDRLFLLLFFLKKKGCVLYYRSWICNHGRPIIFTQHACVPCLSWMSLFFLFFWCTLLVLAM